MRQVTNFVVCNLFILVPPVTKLQVLCVSFLGKGKVSEKIGESAIKPTPLQNYPIFQNNCPDIIKTAEVPMVLSQFSQVIRTDKKTLVFSDQNEKLLRPKLSTYK